MQLCIKNRVWLENYSSRCLNLFNKTLKVSTKKEILEIKLEKTTKNKLNVNHTDEFLEYHYDIIQLQIVQVNYVINDIIMI